MIGSIRQNILLMPGPRILLCAKNAETSVVRTPPTIYLDAPTPMKQVRRVRAMLNFLKTALLVALFELFLITTLFIGFWIIGGWINLIFNVTSWTHWWNWWNTENVIVFAKFTAFAYPFFLLNALSEE